jgi:hypothetical protein
MRMGGKKKKKKASYLSSQWIYLFNTLHQLEAERELRFFSANRQKQKPLFFVTFSSQLQQLLTPLF